MTPVKPMTHHGTGLAQFWLSILFLSGFFTMAIMQGLGYLKLDVIGELKDVLMLVMSFWFMRQRDSTADTHPIQPATPAPSLEKRQ